MGTLNATRPTMLDQIMRMDPDGVIAAIVEQLSENNAILQDAVALEGNMPTGHRTTIRSGLPAVGWKMFNQGIDSSKSQTIQVDEAIGMLAARSALDVQLAKFNGNDNAFRASEDMAFLQSMNQEIARAMFYENHRTNPERFHGLAPRYATPFSGDNVANIINCATAGSTGFTPADACEEMWFLTWGPNTTHLIYPKGSKVGLESDDLGKQLVDDADSKQFTAYVTDWIWKIGLCIRDWRYNARIMNIDIDKIDGVHSDLMLAMVEAYNRIQDFSSGRTVIYCNRTVRTALDKEIMQKSNVNFTLMDWHSRTVPSFRGIPILICDQLTTHTAITS